MASRIENRHAARPINAIAHIYDGGEPPAGDGDGKRNTFLGAGIHTAASIWWASFYEIALASQPRPRRVRTAAAIAVIAYVVDYYVVHKRFRPGFERYLSPRSMFAVYAALAAGYAASGERHTRIRQRKHEREAAALARAAGKAKLAAEEPRQLAADR